MKPNSIARHILAIPYGENLPSCSVNCSNKFPPPQVKNLAFSTTLHLTVFSLKCLSL